jgi:hypothetical protein
VIPAAFFRTLKPTAGGPAPVDVNVNLTGLSITMSQGTPTVEIPNDVFYFASGGGTGADVALVSSSPVWDSVDITWPIGGTVTTDLAVTNSGEIFAYLPNATPYLKVMNVGSWTEISTGISAFAAVPISVSFSRDDTQMVITRGPSPDILVYDTSDWSLDQSINESTAGHGVFSPTEDKFAVLIDTSPYVVVYDSDTWLATTGPTAAGLSVDGGIYYSPDGQYLAVGLIDAPFLQVFNTDDWSAVTLGTTFPDDVTAVAFSHDGAWMAVGGNFAGTDCVRVLDTTTWDDIPDTIQQPTGATTRSTMAFSADDAILAALGPTSDVSMRNALYNTSTWTIDYVLETASAANPRSATFFFGPMTPINVSKTLTGQAITVSSGTPTVSAQRNLSVSLTGLSMTSGQGHLLVGTEHTDDTYWEPQDIDTGEWTGTEWVENGSGVVNLFPIGSWYLGLRPYRVDFVSTGLVGNWGATYGTAGGSVDESNSPNPTLSLDTSALTDDVAALFVGFDDPSTALSKIIFYIRTP